MSSHPMTKEQMLACDPVQSVWVSASAGTGKTRVLVNRMLRLLLSGNAPETILCITFTKAAAAEVLHRIQDTVTSWAVIDDVTLHRELQIVLDRKATKQESVNARRLLPLILQAPGGMRIMTIHAFCQSVLSRFPLEARISPGFRVIDEMESLSLVHEAKQTMLRDLQGTDDAAMRYIYDHLNEEDQNVLIQNILLKRHRLESFLNAHGDDLTQIKKHLYTLYNVSLDVSPELLVSDFIKNTPVARIRAVLDEWRQGSAASVDRVTIIEQWLNNPKNIDLYYRVFFTGGDTPVKNLTPGIKNPSEALLELIRSETERLDVYKQTEAALSLAISALSLTTVARAILGHYAQLKAERNVLDYEDQILLTARLLTDLSNSQWVLYKLDNSINHILVDEAQDTSPAQWTIIESLAEEFFTGQGRDIPFDRTLFIVGDEKQSIFSFQNADPREFDRLRQDLANKARRGNAKWEDIGLIENFRSSPLILQFTDTVFNTNNLVPYLSNAVSKIEHIASHKTKAGMIDLWPLIPATEKENARYTDKPEYILAQEIADHIKSLLDSKTKLSTGDIIRPGDIMILVNKRHPMVAPITKALKERNIAVAGVDRLVLKDQLAVQDCLSALQMGINPFDDYNLACFLKSPFIGLNEDQLFDLSYKRKTSLWEALEQSAHQSIVIYCRQINEWLERYAPCEMIQLLLNNPCPASVTSGRHAIIRRLGHEAGDTLDELLQAVKNFDMLHPPNTQAFLSWLQHNDAAVKKSNTDRDKSRVQIMTAHASKGLQAPIVILADTTTKPESYKSNKDVLWYGDVRDGFLWPNDAGKIHAATVAAKDGYIRDAFAEYYRLLYVALTRAEERLILCGWSKSRDTHPDYLSWYQAVSMAITPTRTYQRFGQEARVIEFKGVSREKEKKSDTAKTFGSIPDILRSVPEQEIQSARPLRPSRPTTPDPAILSPLGKEKNQGFRRGQVIHQLLAIVPEHPKGQQSKILEKILGLQSDLSEAEQKRIYKEVWAILSDPKFDHLFSPEARVEVPVVGEITLDGKDFAVSGQIDRLLVTKDRVMILDYKTNRPPAKNEEQVPESYRHQLRAYKLLMQKIYPDKTIETYLLWTATPYILPVSV